MMHRNVWLAGIILIAMLLGVNNAIYYFTTKKSLEDSQRHELDAVASQIEVSIELSRIGAEQYQAQIGRELRSAAIAAQYALPPDINSVSREQLSELKRKLDLLDITLLRKTKTGSIVLDKSSDPKETGIKTDGWKPWFQAFNQLFDIRNVTIDWGQSLPNFWSGPFEFSTSDTSNINKWGYYYDGSTDYIIDPYISYNARQREYDEQTGVARLIASSLKGNPSLLEIAVINPATFASGPHTTLTDKGDTLRHMTQEPIIGGSNRYKHERDAANVKQASDTGREVWLNTTINGKRVIKLYIPVTVGSKAASMVDGNGDPIGRYVLTLVADYGFIQKTLDEQFLHIGIIIAAVTALSLMAAYLAVAAYRKSRDRECRQT